MTKKYQSECFGCRSTEDLACFINVYEYKILCPCAKCLIKNMCGDGCDTFKEYTENYSSDLRTLFLRK